jgi:hypothetical protein
MKHHRSIYLLACFDLVTFKIYKLCQKLILTKINKYSKPTSFKISVASGSDCLTLLIAELAYSLLSQMLLSTVTQTAPPTIASLLPVL